MPQVRFGVIPEYDCIPWDLGNHVDLLKSLETLLSARKSQNAIYSA
jgi:hypothetical protein